MTLFHVNFSTSTIYMVKCHTLMWFDSKPSVTLGCGASLQFFFGYKGSSFIQLSVNFFWNLKSRSLVKWQIQFMQINDCYKKIHKNIQFTTMVTIMANYWRSNPYFPTTQILEFQKSNFFEFSNFGYFLLLELVYWQ